MSNILHATTMTSLFEYSDCYVADGVHENTASAARKCVVVIAMY